MPASHGTHGSPRPACVGEDQDWPHLPSLQVASVCPGFSLSPLYFEIREGGENHTEFQNVKSCLSVLKQEDRSEGPCTLHSGRQDGQSLDACVFVALSERAGGSDRTAPAGVCSAPRFRAVCSLLQAASVSESECG